MAERKPLLERAGKLTYNIFEYLYHEIFHRLFYKSHFVF